MFLLIYPQGLDVNILFQIFLGAATVLSERNEIITSLHVLNGALLLGLGYLLSGFLLVKKYSVDNARSLLRMSVIYLPALFGIIILDRFI